MTPPALVVGGGALGCLLAGLFARAGPTALLARPGTAAEIRRRRGIHIEGAASGDSTPEITDTPRVPAGACVIVAVKAYDLHATLTGLRSHLDAGHEIVLLQNGIGIRSAGEEILGRPVTRGVTFLAAERLAPGVVRCNAAGKTYLPRGSRSAALWNAAGLPVECVPDVHVYVWRKLAINAVINPLSALLRVENGDLESLAATAAGLIEELVPVAAARGIALDAAETLEKVLASMRQTARNPSSMLQDLRAGRPTEINWINGAIVSLAERHGIPTPRHRLLADLVRFAERRPSRRPR